MTIDPLSLLGKHSTSAKALEIVKTHSQAVVNKAQKLAEKFPQADRTFIHEAGMLHDIGVFFIHAPKIECFGAEPYIKHGLLGAKILRKEGLPKHARIAETHTGVGITKEEIVQRKLPLPAQDFIPETIEEKLISYADLFFSKSNLENLERQESVAEVVADLAKHGQDKVDIFWQWVELFEPEKKPTTERGRS